MIGNIYLLAAYNRYINSLKKFARRIPARYAFGDMVLLKNDSGQDIECLFLYDKVEKGSEVVIPEVRWDIDPKAKGNLSLVSKFIVSQDEFKALRKDVELADN